MQLFVFFCGLVLLALTVDHEEVLFYNVYLGL